MLREACFFVSLACALAACGGSSEVAPAPSSPLPSAPATGLVCAGSSHTCVLQPAGTVVCAGRNRDGQLGDGTGQDRASFVSVRELTSAIDLDCGHEHTCAVRADGHVVCWGRVGAASVHAPIAIEGIDDAVEVSAGRGFSCARRRSGQVACWGEGADGQLGNGASATSDAPVAVVGLSDAVELDAGEAHVCARRASGDVVCWGSNGEGALGTGDTTSSNRPVVAAGVRGATIVDAGGQHSCAVSAAGVQCWGSNADGEIGDPGVGPRALVSVTLPGLAGVTSLGLGARRSCAATASEVRCWGHNDFSAGLLGIANEALRDIDSPARVPGIDDAVSLASGEDFTCAIRRRGGLTCWGAGDDGQLGEGSTRGHPAREVVTNVLTLAPPMAQPPSFAAATPSEPVTPHLALGRAHVCAVLADHRVRCFGENDAGQLGDGSTLPRAGRSAVIVPELVDVLRVVARDRTTCVVRANGEVACWGALDGIADSSSSPVPLPFGDVIDVALASGALCAVTREGTVQCMGEGSAGQLGDGRTEDSATPVVVQGVSNARAIAATASTFCARTSAGTIACWGYDGVGECGNGDASCGGTPVVVSDVTHASDLDGGGADFCVREDAHVLCWGASDHGELAGRPGQADAPVRIDGDAAFVGVGAGAVCLTSVAGNVSCWGASARDGSASALGAYRSADCGTGFCCGLLRAGGVACWGAAPISRARASSPIVETLVEGFDVARSE